MFELTILNQIWGNLTSLFGLGVLTVIAGIILMIICLSILQMDFIYSSAVSGIPFWIWAINVGNQFLWLLGVLVIVYGIVLYTGIKRLISGQ